MRVAVIDFKKSFDPIQHEALWNSLTNQSIRLYTDQRATALTDVESDHGTKQSDPLRRLLLHSVLQSAMEEGIETCKDKGLGIVLSAAKKDCISNLRFADDVFMMASSLKQLKNDRGFQKYGNAWS